MVDVIVQNGSEMALAGDQHPVEAFAAEGANPALRDGVRPRCSNRGADDANVSGGEDRVERGGERGIAVTDQEPEPLGAVAEVLE
jgi:hypothetical protein